MELVLVVLWACVGCYVGYLVGTKVDNENQGAILGLLRDLSDGYHLLE